MYRVLIPLDESVDRGLTQAEYLIGLPVDAESVEVVLMHILENVKQDVPDAMRKPGRVNSVRRVRDLLEDSGFDVRVERAAQSPTEAIKSKAAELDADEIVMGGRKQSPAGKVLFGSVTQSVLLNSDLPVVVTGGS
ncbi:universal stress protein [Salinibaculum salinum]|uniref:universal stress protein n=1 Tax=Salinibaculum salinum TaxID=3131996 RepID=UPI0030EF47F9